MSIRSFDLNIEEVLENWEVHHALREVIANALDEQLLTNSGEIQILQDRQGKWRIRDFGRGIRIEHFTLNEDLEKLSSPLPIIGKFGVGLKDALATFQRRGVGVLIQSTHGTFRLRRESKHGFEDIVTLHVEFDDSSKDIKGTEFILSDVTAEQISKAKSLFLKFSNERILDTNAYGQILSRRSGPGRVYILGVFAAEEPNFLFSYNITNLTQSMKKRLNRERLNVGRTTYADRVKAILKNANSEVVREGLIDQVRARARGDQCDEMSWIEISQLALNLMHQKRQVAYVTETELQTRPDLIGSAKTDGYEVVVISDRQKSKAEDQVRTGGPELRTLQVYAREYDDSFQYEFVDERDLSRQEKSIYDLTSRVLELVGISRHRAPKVRISETVRLTSTDTDGVWDSSINAIVVKRNALRSLRSYAGTLLHEAAHATTGAPDVSRMLENVLTSYLGMIAEAAIRR
jgi:hypothetical protein